MSATQVPLQQLGQLVRATRKEQGMRLVEAAGLCGVSPRFLSELENGRDTCTLRLVLQVCNTLGIDLYAQRRDGVPR
jgi:transcriptional regulator with XRE-family HTH domain